MRTAFRYKPKLLKRSRASDRPSRYWRINTDNLTGKLLQIDGFVTPAHRVFPSAAFSLFTEYEPLEATSHIRDGDCGVLLLCYSISDDWRKGLIDQYRQHCPDGRIVLISNQPIEEQPKNVDLLMYRIDGPEALLDAVAGRKAA